MTQKNMILTLIIAAVVAIFGFMIYESNQDTPAENFADGVNEFTEEVGDEVDDATTN